MLGRAMQIREHWENECFADALPPLASNNCAPPGRCGSRRASRDISLRRGGSLSNRRDLHELRWPLCSAIAVRLALSPQRDWLGLPDSPRRADRRRDGLDLRFFTLQSRKLDRVVGAEQLDVADRQPREFAQPGQVCAPRRIVGADETLERPQARWRNASARLDLGTVEISVAAMEEPILRPPHRDAAMAARVARQRDQENLALVPGIARTAEKPTSPLPAP